VPIVDHQMILRVHAAAVAVRLDSSRSALLSGLPADLAAGLPPAPTPAAQLLSDLHQLNDTGRLPDGAVPLQTWLSNAIALCGSLVKADVFRQALDASQGAPLLSPPSLRKRKKPGKTAGTNREGTPSDAVKTVLWVEDDRFALQTMSACLRDLEYEVIAAKTAKEALRILDHSRSRFRCAIVDLMLPGAGNAIEPPGLRLARTVKKRWPDLPLLCLSNLVHAEAAQWFTAHGIGYFQKQHLDDSRGRFVRAIEIATTGRSPPPRALIVHAGNDSLMRELKDHLTGVLGWKEVAVLREIPSDGRSILRKFSDESREIDVLFILLSRGDTTLASSEEQIPGRGADLGFELGYVLGSARRRSLTTILMMTDGAPYPPAVADVVLIRVDGGVSSVATELHRALDKWH
jgi:CheY-like chemotaxis protein